MLSVAKTKPIFFNQLNIILLYSEFPIPESPEYFGKSTETWFPQFLLYTHICGIVEDCRMLLFFPVVMLVILAIYYSENLDVTSYDLSEYQGRSSFRQTSSFKKKKKAKEPDNMVQMQSESLDREWMLSLIVKISFVAFFR